MENDRVTMTNKELQRMMVMGAIEEGRVTNGQAAEVLGLSVRQVQRLRKAYREKGAVGLAHGNRGKVSPRRMCEEVREQVVGLVKHNYADYNTRHLVEMLAEEHGLEVSYSTLRRLRLAANVPSPRRRRAARHHARRERKPLAGMLLQTDSSDHDWLEGRGPRLTLISYIDDATNDVMGAVFREEEDAMGYMQGLLDLTQTHGLPVAIYADRHSIFRNPKEATLEQQLAGKEPRGQYGRALDELGIQLIAAHSPQAKGRIERLFQTFQDRLVKELRRANASTRDQANQVLARYLPGFNQHFTKQAAQPGSAFRPWPADLRPDDVLCFKYSRVVRNDNTFAFDGLRLSIPPGPAQRSYARARVEVRQHLDGQLSAHYQGLIIATFQAIPGPARVNHFSPAEPLPQPTPTAPPPPKLPAPRQPHTPAPDHPWRRYPNKFADKQG
jgi:transposase